MRYMTPARCAAATQLLADLVRIESVNNGPAEADALNPEAGLVDYLEPRLRELGLTTTRFEVRAGRQNLLGRLAGPADQPPLTLEAHTDTVGVSGMTVPPFAAEIRGDCMVGRGTCDTKGSLAAFLTALRVAREEDWRFDRPLQFLAAMGEEAGCEGAVAMVETGVDLGWVIVGEPTRGEVVVGHKGCLWFEIVCAGRAAHASTPAEGDNAIYRMHRVLAWLCETWLPALATRRHPLLGEATGSVGLIAGGEKVNVIPSRCRLEVDHRLLPGMDGAALLAELTAALRAQLGEEAEQVTVRALGPPFPGFAEDPDSPLASRLRAAVKAAGGQGTATGVTYFSDAGPYRAAGFPTVVFGPGDIRHAHGPEEYVRLPDVHRAAEAICHLLAGLRV